MRPVAILLTIAVALTAGACSRRDDPPPPDDPITFERNSEFSTLYLRVFLTLDDGTEVSVNTTHDAVATRNRHHPHPRPSGTELDVRQGRGHRHVGGLRPGELGPGDEPADYLMAGWWAQFPGQHLPDLSFRDSIPVRPRGRAGVRPVGPPPIAGGGAGDLRRAGRRSLCICSGKRLGRGRGRLRARRI